MLLRVCPVVAQNLSTSPNVSDRVSARSLGKISLWVSVVGIVIGSVTIITVIAVMLSYGQQVASVVCKHSVDGHCYANREKLSSVECLSKGHHYDHYSHYCYY